MAEAAAVDVARGDASATQRRFVVVEGLYANHGDVAPLAEVVALARAYHWRVILDDSCGFGALGARGTGAAEHAGLAPPGVDVLLGSLATSLSSVGGFCVGSREVVDHQRLSGAGYCFSASAPPFLCATASAALARLRAEPALAAALQARAAAMHGRLAAAGGGALALLGDAASPIKHLLLTVGPAAALPHGAAAERLFAAAARPSLAAPDAASARAAADARAAEERLLAAAVRRLVARGVLASYTHYQPTDYLAPRPTLRLVLTLAHSEEELTLLVEALAEVARGLPALAEEMAASGADADEEEEEEEELAEGEEGGGAAGGAHAATEAAVGAAGGE